MEPLIWKELNIYKQSLKSIRFALICIFILYVVLMRAKMGISEVSLYIILCGTTLSSVFVPDEYCETLLSSKFTVRQIVFATATCLLVVSLLINLIFVILYYVYNGFALIHQQFDLSQNGILTLVGLISLIYSSFCLEFGLISRFGNKVVRVTLLNIGLLYWFSFAHYHYTIIFLTAIALMAINEAVLYKLSREEVIRRSLTS